MEQLLDLADALALTAGENASDPITRPDFEIPKAYHVVSPFNTPFEIVPPFDRLQIKNTVTRGQGWFAQKNIQAGDTLMIAKPLAMVLDRECDDEMNDIDDDMEADEEPYNSHESSQSNIILTMQLLEKFKTRPELWIDFVSTLYPRIDSVDKNSSFWSSDERILARFDALIKELDQIPQLHGKISTEISQRLPQIVKNNVLSIETSPELISYPGRHGHSCIAGVGLFHLPSFFNHDSKPNASRYAVGDIMFIVANQDIASGTEICISYIEHDMLCESSQRRNLVMADWGFSEIDDGIENNGPDFPVVDSEVQNELMEMNPFERLDAIQQLMQQAMGESARQEQIVDDDDCVMDTAVESGGLGSDWFQCDLQNLRILKAISLESVGQSRQAASIWDECINFCETKMPPNDESSIVVRVQAALCAWNNGECDLAREHASVAFHVHNLLFGGGMVRFHRRYRNEFRLSLRPERKDELNSKLPHDILWPIPSPGS